MENRDKVLELGIVLLELIDHVPRLFQSLRLTLISAYSVARDSDVNVQLRPSDFMRIIDERLK